MDSLGVAGVVLGAVIAGWLEAVLLGASLWRRLGGLGLEHLPYARLILLTLVTWLAPWALKQGLGSKSSSWLTSFAVLASAGVAFAVATVALGVFDLRRLLRRR